MSSVAAMRVCLQMESSLIVYRTRVPGGFSFWSGARPALGSPEVD